MVLETSPGVLKPTLVPETGLILETRLGGLNEGGYIAFT